MAAIKGTFLSADLNVFVSGHSKIVASIDFQERALLMTSFSAHFFCMTVFGISLHLGSVKLLRLG